MSGRGSMNIIVIIVIVLNMHLFPESLKDDLDHFIREHFPTNLVKLVRMPERVGLIRARLEGFRHVTSEVVSFFDSHMEVNVDWYGLGSFRFAVVVFISWLKQCG